MVFNGFYLYCMTLIFKLVCLNVQFKPYFFVQCVLRVPAYCFVFVLSVKRCISAAW